MNDYVPTELDRWNLPYSKMYVAKIQAGEMTIQECPVGLRPQIQRLLNGGSI